ncbi:WLM domain-containing protein [Trichophaea hybrida]|nr:WLM domain-containing protein [Trichophaea hybrida]
MPARNADQLIGTYTHLPNFARPQHALQTLRRLASLVKPIMLSHSFHVGTLSEFYPAETNLLGLNINGGEKICIRLRAHYDASTFLPEEQIVGTMLHELTHNVHGPHDEKFYGFLKKLEEEYYALRARGWNGEGFYSEGRRLGGRNPLGFGDSRRRRALKAAEERNAWAQGSGQKLGGGGAVPTPWNRYLLRETLASAVERRLRDNKTCGRGNVALGESSRNGFATKAEEDDANDQAILRAQIEMIEEEERGWREEGGVVRIDDDDDDDPGPSAKLPASTIAAGNAGGEWTCNLCTLINEPTFLCCDVCGSQRPGPSVPPTPQRPRQREPAPLAKNRFLSKASEAILAAPEKKPEQKWWTCHQCALMNEDMWWTCQSCGVFKLKS